MRTIRRRWADTLTAWRVYRYACYDPFLKFPPLFERPLFCLPLSFRTAIITVEYKCITSHPQLWAEEETKPCNCLLLEGQKRCPAGSTYENAKERGLGMKKSIALLVALAFIQGAAWAEELSVTMNLLTPEGVGRNIGTVTVTDSKYGAVFTPMLEGLTPGLHGFHVHQNPSCAPAEKDGKMVPGLAAGGHYDPQSTGMHEAPFGNGHLGDLPGLYVDADGKATHPVLAPRLKLSDLQGRSLMIHAGGDNYADIPNKLGGGGARVACGVF
jgi:Cu-Zn family superoxide dismutase